MWIMNAAKQWAPALVPLFAAFMALRLVGKTEHHVMEASRSLETTTRMMGATNTKNSYLKDVIARVAEILAKPDPEDYISSELELWHHDICSKCAYRLFDPIGYTPYFGEAIFFFGAEGDLLGVLDLIANKAVEYNESVSSPGTPGPPQQGAYPNANNETQHGTQLWIDVFEFPQAWLPEDGGIFGHLIANNDTGVAHFEYLYYGINPDDLNDDAQLFNESWFFWFYGDDYPYQFTGENTTHLNLEFIPREADQSLALAPIPNASGSESGEFTWTVQKASIGLYNEETVCSIEYVCPREDEGQPYEFYARRFNRGGRGCRCEEECRRSFDTDLENVGPSTFNRDFGDWECGTCPNTNILSCLIKG